MIFLSQLLIRRVSLSKYRESRASDKVKNIVAMVNKIRDTFKAIGHVVSECMGSNVLQSGAKAVVGTIALFVPGMNMFALAWRIAKTVYFVGKSIYYLTQTAISVLLLKKTN